MKILTGLTIATLFVVAPTLSGAADYNTDSHPSAEVAPGIYGKMFSTVTSKFNLAIGGYLKLDYAYNSTNLGSNGVITPISGAIPSKSINGTGPNSATFANQDQSVFSMKQSRIWFKIDGPPLVGAKTGGFLEVDFYGDNSGAAESPMPRLRHAYGTIDWPQTQVLFGQYWDMFAPMIASTEDFRTAAPQGAPYGPRIPQIRLTQKVDFTADHQLKLVFAVQDPNQTGDNQSSVTGQYGPSVNYAGQIFYVNKGLGTAPGYMSLSMNPLTVGVFGLYGTEKALSNANNSLSSWGYGLYTFAPLLRSKDGVNRAMTLAFEGQAYEAGNLAYSGATAISVVGTTPAGGTQGSTSNTFDAAGNQKPARNWAFIGQLKFFPIQDLGFTAGFGSRYALNNGDYANITNYQRQSRQIYANVTYDLNAAIRLATEYQNIETKYGNVNGVSGAKASGVDNTVRLCAYYFF
ncbi:hypothetical protein OR1_00915 [Geobacter sp. OR-1]|uniref:hypothetical protein n=1 Tax=Geobacter sp. OR-1 TaxID=1266765 RepID=UPI000542B6C1|nr:hypothetical protein [Geobacter sp. OR-1]GAM08643.1 hypothetical protein OR1_00915 [Geobacter sp. OR-1]